MRAFQPIARRMEVERNRNLWMPPPALRKIAWSILIGAIAFEIIAGWRVALYLVAVHKNPGYALMHMCAASPLLVVAPIAMILCIPFVTSRDPSPRRSTSPTPSYRFAHDEK
jgi:hypothetical protein